MVRYLEAENAYTEAMTAGLKPFADALYQEMLGRIKQTDLSVPVRRGDYLYYSRTEEGQAISHPVPPQRAAMDAPEEVLLDLNELAKTHKFVGLGDFAVSDDPEPAGLYRGFHRLPAVHAAGEGSAHRRDCCRDTPSA